VVGGGGCELRVVIEREWVLLCCNVNREGERERERDLYIYIYINNCI
jgi:hypothetical protein